MKLPVLLACLLCLACAVPGRATEAGESPAQQARTFYAWYMHALNTEGDPLHKSKAGLKRYVSARFLKELDRFSKVEDGIDADPFLCAQDLGGAWEKNITVSDVTVEGDHARGQVNLKGPEMNSYSLLVQWVREGGAWKIDRVRAKKL